MASQKTNKIVNIVVDVVVAIIIILALALAINTLVSKSKNQVYNSVGGKIYAVVRSNSMDGLFGNDGKYPESWEGNAAGWQKGFKKGDIVIVNELSFEEKQELKEGDVITYLTTIQGVESLNTHRITKITRNTDGTIQSLTTQGDNQEYADRIITLTEVVGKYQGKKLLGIGNITLALETQVGFLCIVVIPAVLVVIYCAIKLILALNQDKKRRAVLAEEEKQKAVEEAKALAREELLKEMGKPDDIQTDNTALDSISLPELPTDSDNNDTQV